MSKWDSDPVHHQANMQIYVNERQNIWHCVALTMPTIGNIQIYANDMHDKGANWTLTPPLIWYANDHTPSYEICKSMQIKQKTTVCDSDHTHDCNICKFMQTRRWTKCSVWFRPRPPISYANLCKWNTGQIILLCPDHAHCVEYADVCKWDTK